MMRIQEIIDSAKRVDEYLSVIYLEVPRSQIVMLQVYCELYDGVATIRTAQAAGSKPAPTLPKGQNSNKTDENSAAVISVLTSPSNVETCARLLVAVRENVAWRLTRCDSDPFIDAQMIHKA